MWDVTVGGLWVVIRCAVLQMAHDVMLQEFAGEGIPLLASAVPAETFFPFLNELLPLIMSKAVSLYSLLVCSQTKGLRYIIVI